ncbi:MAG: DinB family protein [Gemmatimonadetes bacterium]|nr:DinB family protein [Gemmatimonadota bacterium]
MTTVVRLVSAVDDARQVLLDNVDGLSTAQGAWKPSADEWSVAEIVEHLFLAEFSGVSKIWVALEDVRAGKRWTEQNPNRGRSIEDIIASTWKPKEKAPPIATPNIGGPLAYWVSATRTLGDVLADLGRELDPYDLSAIVYPHFLCGPLDARQRLEFLRFHIERHVAQIERVKGDPGFPK